MNLIHILPFLYSVSGDSVKNNYILYPQDPTIYVTNSLCLTNRMLQVFFYHLQHCCHSLLTKEIVYFHGNFCTVNACEDNDCIKENALGDF